MAGIYTPVVRSASRRVREPIGDGSAAPPTAESLERTSTDKARVRYNTSARMYSKGGDRRIDGISIEYWRKKLNCGIGERDVRAERVVGLMLGWVEVR
jgi:hypothetical protein